MIINPGNIEKWCFDYFEGNLTSLEKLEFERFILEHPEYHSEFEAWKEASESDEDQTPAFIGMEGLLVGIPFYATFAFKVSVGALFTLALGVLGYYQMQNLSVERQYYTEVSSLDMNWSPEKHKLALVKYEDYSYGDYEIDTVTSTTYTTHYVYESNNGSTSVGNGDLNNLVSSVTPSFFANPQELADESLVDNSTSGDFITYLGGNEVREEDLFTADYCLTENLQEDDKNLYEHLGINSSKFQFLNFNNSKVRGLGSGHAKKNKKRNKTDNQAIIAQNNKGGKPGSHKKKSHFFENLKHIELGLSNINDPIATAPNSNIIGVNPALAGQLGVTRVKLNVRNQWWNTEESTFKGSMYLDTYFEKIQAGVAYGMEYDMTQSGEQMISKYAVTYAQKFSVGKGDNISVGLTYEMSKGLNTGSSTNMIEFYKDAPIASNSIDNQWKSNLGIATWYSGKYFFGGFNVTNLLGTTFIATHEENTSYINDLNYSVQLGTDYKRSMFSKTVVSPYVQYNKLGDHSDLWLGSVVRIKGLVLGGSVATSKSARATLGLQGNKFRFTVNSDYAKSQLLDQYAFSHEVSLRILIGNKNNNWSRYDY